MITGIDNIGIAVRDLQAAVGFFQDGLGLELSRPIEPGAHSASISVRNGQSLFIWQTDDTNPIGRNANYQNNPPGIDHISFAVEDIEVASSELERRGIKFLGPLRGAKGQFRSRAFTDDDGNVFYVVQRA